MSCWTRTICQNICTFVALMVHMLKDTIVHCLFRNFLPVVKKISQFFCDHTLYHNFYHNLMACAIMINELLIVHRFITHNCTYHLVAIIINKLLIVHRSITHNCTLHQVVTKYMGSYSRTIFYICKIEILFYFNLSVYIYIYIYICKILSWKLEFLTLSSTLHNYLYL